MKKRKVFLAMLLAICMIAIQGMGLAESIEQTQPEFWEYLEERTVSSEVVPVIESKALSDEYTKTTLMSDGSYTQVTSVEPIAFFDVDDKLQFIDNSIVPTEVTKGNVNYVFTNTQNKFDCFFADSTSINSAAARIEYQNSAISVSALNLTNADARIYDADDFISTSDYIDNNGSSVIYSNNSNLSVVYAVHNTSLNQKFVINNLGSARPPSLTYTMQLDGISVSTTSTGEIEFINAQNEKLYALDGMVAIDANGKMTDRVDFSVTTNNSARNRYTVNVSIDADFMSDSALAFPLVINANYSVVTPTLRTPAVLQCAYVNERNLIKPNALVVGQSVSLAQGGKSRIYIKSSDMASLALNSQIVRAYYSLQNIQKTAANLVLYARSIPDNVTWSPSNIFWSNQPISGTSVPSIDPSLLPSVHTNGSMRCSIDITPLTSCSSHMISTQYEATFEGKLSFFKDNTILSNAAPTRIVTYVRETFAQNMITIKPVADKSFVDVMKSENPEAGYSAAYKRFTNAIADVSYPFEFSWNCPMNTSEIYYSSLPGNDCSHSLDYACTFADCGDVCVNNGSTPNHHRNAYKNYAVASQLGVLGTSDLQITIVAFMNCAEGNHSWVQPSNPNAAVWSSIWGLAGGDYVYIVYDRNGNEWDNPYMALVHVLYHEISHTFNCGHDGESYNGGIWHCSENQYCCMSDPGFKTIENTNLRTIWCDNCMDFRFNRNAH